GGGGAPFGSSGDPFAFGFPDDVGGAAFVSGAGESSWEPPPQAIAAREAMTRRARFITLCAKPDLQKAYRQPRPDFFRPSFHLCTSGMRARNARVSGRSESAFFVAAARVKYVSCEASA